MGRRLTTRCRRTITSLAALGRLLAAERGDRWTDQDVAADSDAISGGWRLLLSLEYRPGDPEAPQGSRDVSGEPRRVHSALGGSFRPALALVATLPSCSGGGPSRVLVDRCVFRVGTILSTKSSLLMSRCPTGRCSSRRHRVARPSRGSAFRARASCANIAFAVAAERH